MNYAYREYVQNGDDLIFTGGSRNIVASMQQPPPVRFEEAGKVYVRDWGGRTGAPLGSVKAGGATTHRGASLPVSHTLPRVQEHEVVGPANYGGHDVLELKNGHYATADGQRIVDNAKAADAHAAACGYTREK